MTQEAVRIAQTAPVIKVDGSDLSAASLNALSTLRVERAFCTVSRATLRFLDAGYELSAQGTLTIGKEIQVQTQAPDRSMVTIFQGEIVSASLDQAVGYAPELVVVADDKVHRMARTAATLTYQQMSAKDIIMKAAREAGLQSKVADTKITFDYLIQGGSALDYTDQLAARSGMVWWCEYPGKLVVGPPDADGSTLVPFDLGPQGVARDFSVRSSARNIAAVSVTGWDAATTQEIKAENKKTRPFVSNFVSDKSSTFSGPGLGHSDLNPLTQQEATALADALHTEAEHQSVTARGTCPVEVKLVPGVRVDVKNAGPASGKYRVTAVEHRYDRQGFTSTFTAGPLRGGGLVDLMAGPPPDAGLNLETLVVGIVTQIANDSSAGKGAQAGMVKVKLPSLPGGPESDWARVLTVGGGKERGAVFLPEVDDEVLVAFERGDTRRPIVLGGLFSKKNTFPGTNPAPSGSIDSRRIKSREAHLLEFSDKSGEEYVLLEHGKKQHSMKLTNEGIEITSKGDLTLKTDGGSLTIKSNGDVELKSNGKITVKAAMDLAMEGNNIKAKANLNAEIEGSVNAKLKGGAQTSLEGSGMTVVKGSMVKIN